MDNIMAIIKGSSRQHTWSKNVRDMMHSVVELRSSNWGRQPEPPVTTADPGFGVAIVPNNAYVVNGALVQSGPIFYAANGMQISAQEAGYMSEVDYIQQLHWGNENGGAGDAGNFHNYRNGAGRGRNGAGRGGGSGGAGGVEDGTVGGGYAILGQSQNNYDGNVPYENYDGYDYEGVDPYEAAVAAASANDNVWSTNDEMTDDMIDAFEQFILENNMGPPNGHGSGPNGYGNNH